MKYNKVLLSTFIIFGLTACSNPLNLILPSKRVKHKKHTQHKIHYEKPTAAKEEMFKQTMNKVAQSTLADARYNKMDLDTPEKKAWFKNLMYRLWDRQITRRQFIAEGLSKYPSNIYEFAFVAHGFQKNS